jgi:hypothetical protein
MGPKNHTHDHGSMPIPIGTADVAKKSHTLSWFYAHWDWNLGHYCCDTPCQPLEHNPID